MVWFTVSQFGQVYGKCTGQIGLLPAGGFNATTTYAMLVAMRHDPSAKEEILADRVKS